MGRRPRRLRASIPSRRGSSPSATGRTTPPACPGTPSKRSFFIASRARTAAGALLFGSPEGLLVVDPGRLAPWTWEPPVVATALRVDGVERPGAARLARLEWSGRNAWVGVEAGTGDPRVAVRRFREAPEDAMAAGVVRLQTSPGLRLALRLG